MVPPIKLMDRGMDTSKYTYLLTRCLVKASRILPERYKVLPPPPPCLSFLSVKRVLERGGGDVSRSRLCRQHSIVLAVTLW
jgi:hypothetical protein